MNLLSAHFSELFRHFTAYYPSETYAGDSRASLMEQIPTGKRGVYTYWKKGAINPFYIGCSGKIDKTSELCGNTMKSRMFQANTPYHFSKTENYLFFEPTTATVPPAGYQSYFQISEVEIKTIEITDKIAPAALEHLLIQGFINEYGCLPLANQKI